MDNEQKKEETPNKKALCYRDNCFFPIPSLFFIMPILFMLVACGSKEEDVRSKNNNLVTQEKNDDWQEAKVGGVGEDQESPKQHDEDLSAPVDDDLEKILLDIDRDFDNAISMLQSELDMVYSTTGDTYDDYVANKKVLSDWYAQLPDKMSRLYKSTMDNSIVYFRNVASSADHSDSDTVDNAMNVFQKRVYEDAFGKLDDVIYENTFNEINDRYYDGIFGEQTDEVDFVDWFNEKSECYSEWLDAKSDFYAEWLDAKSEIYGVYLDVLSEFWIGNFDVDSIFEDVDVPDVSTEEFVEPTEDDGGLREKISSEPVDAPSDTPSDTVNPELKAFLDEYEAFMNEYIDFIKKYEGSNYSTEMLLDYTRMLEKYADFAQAVDEYDLREMSAADAAYYIDVTSRVSKKLLEAY